MRFERGQSGNPGGPPKDYGEIRDPACRGCTRNAGRDLPARENKSARVAAPHAILDRDWGKPAVAIVADDLPPVITFKMGARNIRPAAEITDVTPTPDERLLPLPRLSALSDEQN